MATRERRHWLLGVLAVAAYQFGFHIYILSTFVPGERTGGLAEMSVVVGTPPALAWAVFAARYARRAFEARSIPATILFGAAGYAVAMVLAFTVFVSNRLGWDTAQEWLLLIPLITVLSTAILPGSLAVCLLNPVWETVALVAFGVPTVGPILLLIWWTASRKADTARPPAMSEVPTKA